MPVPVSSNGRKTSTPQALPDTQSRTDHRNVAIDRVGVRGVQHPLTVRAANGTVQTTVAEVGMFVALPAERKGTHMSRFLQVLAEHAADFDFDAATSIARHLRERLDADDASVELQFPYFLQKAAPVSGETGVMAVQVRMSCRSGAVDETRMAITVPATSLCPCSKEISEGGAHSQRCHISAEILCSSRGPTIEQLVGRIEGAASCPTYAVLKRPDEKFVTERAYDNPKFVEDIVRDLAVQLDADPAIAWYHVASENFESIHGHNAYAELTRDKR
jgi:GTP cyclohydrolase I